MKADDQERRSKAEALARAWRKTPAYRMPQRRYRAKQRSRRIHELWGQCPDGIPGYGEYPKGHHMGTPLPPPEIEPSGTHDLAYCVAEQEPDGRDWIARGLGRREALELLRKALKRCTYREREVINLRYGLSDGRARTLQDVARMFRVTRERIRQIEAKAINRLPRIIRRDFPLTLPEDLIP